VKSGVPSLPYGRIGPSVAF